MSGLIYNEPMNTNTLEWLACIAGVTGALFVALNIGLAPLGYKFFLAGAIGYCIVAFVKNNNPLLLLNLVFAATNIIGLVRH